MVVYQFLISLEFMLPYHVTNQLYLDYKYVQAKVDSNLIGSLVLQSSESTRSDGQTQNDGLSKSLRVLVYCLCL